jgi:hypothetical protein
VSKVGGKRTDAIEKLKGHEKDLRMATKTVDEVSETISRDERILRRYVGAIYRLRGELARFWPWR